MTVAKSMVIKWIALCAAVVVAVWLVVSFWRLRDFLSIAIKDGNLVFSFSGIKIQKAVMVVDYYYAPLWAIGLAIVGLLVAAIGWRKIKRRTRKGQA